MLSANTVAALTLHLTIDGFAFDVELLYLVGIICRCRQDSRVRVRAGIASVFDVLRSPPEGAAAGPPAPQAGFTFSARGPFGP